VASTICWWSVCANCVLPWEINARTRSGNCRTLNLSMISLARKAYTTGPLLGSSKANARSRDSNAKDIARCGRRSSVIGSGEKRFPMERLLVVTRNTLLAGSALRRGCDSITESKSRVCVSCDAFAGERILQLAAAIRRNPCRSEHHQISPAISI